MPLFLSLPEYLGTAGPPAPTRWKPAVHAINELLERDALSLLLIGQFLRERPERLAVVDPATLPDEVAALLAFAEATRVVGST
ncbi:hypothetical protein ACFWIA_34165 [Streptomyces sp. NPDC127068]|uniref:hypothetical protein n=1 Tax=Streptomyces sp. NPDC127068 TaxID=3347127 RepID=UPI00365C90A4